MEKAILSYARKACLQSPPRTGTGPQIKFLVGEDVIDIIDLANNAYLDVTKLGFDEDEAYPVEYEPENTISRNTGLIWQIVGWWGNAAIVDVIATSPEPIRVLDLLYPKADWLGPTGIQLIIYPSASNTLKSDFNYQRAEAFYLEGTGTPNPLPTGQMGYDPEKLGCIL